jgi:hypothetical protein
MKRVSGVRDLLMFQGSFVYTATPVEERERRWKITANPFLFGWGKGPSSHIFSGSGRRIGSNLRTQAIDICHQPSLAAVTVVRDG